MFDLIINSDLPSCVKFNITKMEDKLYSLSRKRNKNTNLFTVETILGQYITHAKNNFLRNSL